MVGAIIGGFTILGAFLMLTAWINGRTIKKYIGELIERESKATRELIIEMVDKLSAQHETMIKILQEMKGK